MRLIARILALFLYPMALMGQSANVPPTTATGTATPVLPAGTVLCSVPKNGGVCITKVPISLQPINVTLNIPAVSAPVSLSGFKSSISCQLSPSGTLVVEPNGTISITGLTCTLTQ